MKQYSLLKDIICESNVLLKNILDHNLSCVVNESNMEYDDVYFANRIEQIFGLVEKYGILDKKYISGVGFELDQDTLNFETELKTKAFAYDNNLPTIEEYVEECINVIDSLIQSGDTITKDIVSEQLQRIYNTEAKQDFDLLTESKGSTVELENVRLGDRVERLNDLLECVDIEESHNQFNNLLTRMKDYIMENTSLSIESKADCLLALLEDSTSYYAAHQETFKSVIMQEKSIILSLLEQKYLQDISDEISNNLDIDIF